MSESGKITAQEIRHQDFTTKMRGYDKEEVDQYLALLADGLEKDANQVEELQQKIQALEKQLSEFKELEGTLKNTLLRTQESADDVRRNAERESELIIREAQVKADKIAEEKKDKIRKLDNQYDALQLKWDEYFSKFKNLLTSHLDILDKLENDYKKLAQESHDLDLG